LKHAFEKEKPLMSATGTRQMQVDTRERVLDAAENLFAREGLSRPSVRQITSEAGVNVAAVNYHFGSREGLVEAVFERHATAVNAERIEKLNAILSMAGNKRPSLTAILEAYLEVRLRHRKERDGGSSGLKQLFGHLLAEPPEIVEPLMQKHFQPTTDRFLTALAKALPELPREELEFRFQLVMASLATTATTPPNKHNAPSNGQTPTTDTGPMDDRQTIQKLVTFLAAGLRAPSAMQS
jgi:AcrR family transcriptional regulator